jgi:Lon protease-like protein
MFPLGRALLPGEPVPLRVFEPRYVEMMGAVLAGDREFGVVLISRGWEVGGGDERVGIGTIASIADSVELGEEQLAVVGIGTIRFRVDRWLPDDPYPVAMVELLTDGETGVDPERIEALHQQTARLYALASELGADVSGQDLSLPDEPAAALWRLCSLVPLGELDRQRLLEAPDGASRAALLGELLAEVTEELTLRLAAG